MSDRERMDDRVHARLVADGLDMGMSGTEALGWADLRMKSAQADAIRLGLACADFMAEYKKGVEAAIARIAAAL